MEGKGEPAPSHKKRRLTSPETPDESQHPVEVFEELLHNVKQLCQTFGDRFTRQQNDDKVSLEITRTEGDGKLSLTVASTHTKWRDLSDTSADARRQLGAQISRREQELNRLHAESKALRLRIEVSDSEQGCDELGRELCQVHRTIGRHNEALQKLRKQSMLEVEANIDHVDRRLEITLSTLSRTGTQKVAVPVDGAWLYVFGGYGRGSSGDFDRLAATHCYDPKNDVWTRCSSLMQARSSFAGAALGGQLYAIGGLASSNIRTTTAERLDVRQPEKGWEAIARAPREIIGSSALSFDGSLFVLGGYCQGRYTNDVLRYDPVANNWSNCARLSRPRGYFGGAIVDGHAYVFGGIDNNNKILDHTEKCDLEHNGQWLAVAPLKTARWGCSSAVLNKQLYAMGGLATGGRTLRSVERYDPALDEWHEIAPMLEAREDSCAAVLCDELYVLGGTDANQEPLASIERYNEKQNAWQFVTNLPGGITLAGCAVVS